VSAFEHLPPGILRIKGLVRFSHNRDAEVCQYVGGRLDFSRHDSRFDGPGFVIVIGKEINPETLPGLLRRSGSE